MARRITILGAGLVGSLLGILLRKRGHEVTIYEGRPDARAMQTGGGRSINLTISARGWKALELAGLRAEIEAIAIPMYGRYMHQADGNRAFQPYSKNNDAISSVSRSELNKRLMTLAEESGVKIYFEHRCTNVDVPANIACFELPDKSEKMVQADILFGADGAFSALRESYSRMSGVYCDKSNLEYGYKELSILPGNNNEWLLEKNALHIWPRGSHMLIAMPNTNGTFTCTLFMPFEGAISFEQLKTEADVTAFFDEQFTDAKAMMPGLVKDFFTNPASTLVTTHISKWYYKGQSALIGDAAHAIVPFYGQGMNAGFEDCTVLSELMDKYGDDWESIFTEYEQQRKPNGDAVSELAMHNFAEIRDKVADPAFLERKKIEKELNRRFPNQFVPVYEMVSFTHAPYDKAMRSVQEQDKLLQTIMQEGDFFKNIKDGSFVKMLGKLINQYYTAIQQPRKTHAVTAVRNARIRAFFPLSYRVSLPMSA